MATAEAEVNPAGNQSNNKHSELLQQLILHGSVHDLENEVKQSRTFLASLELPFQEHKTTNADTTQYLTNIQDLQKQVVDTPIIIGIVGNTGYAHG